jgi:hypothetical protein
MRSPELLDTSNLYTLYLDESSVDRPGRGDKYELFALGGILIRKSDERDLTAQLEAFKNRWSIGQNVPLHASAIRSKKENFRFLESFAEEPLIKFKTEILDMILGSEALLHCCVVSRYGYRARYQERYGRKTWKMLKSATIIVVERAAKVVAARGGKLYVVFERGNASNNNIIRDAYSELRNSGAPFDVVASSKYVPMRAEALSDVLFNRIEDKTKATPLLQVADLCLRPLMEPLISGNSVLFDKLQEAGRLINCVVSDAEKEGIKYYCFD